MKTVIHKYVITNLDAIADLPTIPEGYKWDGHSTEEKYERLAKLDAPTWIAQ